MPASERTPLLTGSTSNGVPTKQPRARSPPAPSSLSTSSHSPSLYSQANALISHLSTTPPSSQPTSTSKPTWSPSTPQVNLAVHLYALHLLQPGGGHDTPAMSIRARIAREEEAGRVRWQALEGCEGILDRVGEAGEDGEGAGGEGGEEETDEVVLGMLWGQWAIREPEGRWVSAIDLMLPPFAPRDHVFPLLSHPVVRHILDLAWHEGLQTHGPMRRASLGRAMGSTTPARLHALHLVSILVLFGLTLAVAISPGGLIAPYETESPKRVTAMEVVWMIWAGADLLQTIQYPTPLFRRFCLLPTQITFLLALLPNFSSFAYTFLTLSIPFLTFLLILPAAPSFPVLLPELLPLSVLLRRVLYRSAKTAGIMMPLVGVVFGVFAWSMNGDVYRGFFLSPSLPLITAMNHDMDDPVEPDPTDPPPDISPPTPIEPGIAPFQARLSLFLTFTFLLLFSAILAAARSLSPPREDTPWDPSDSKRCRGAVKEGDGWEREWGVGVGREARREWAVGVREYVVGGEAWGVGRERLWGGAEEGGEAARDGVSEGWPWLPGRSLLWLRWPPPLSVLVAPFQLVNWIMAQWRKRSLSPE
ncbi:hypothetical protein IAT38_008212 [Cryptococcus sp. DSM 104549]